MHACKWGQASVVFDVPAELAELLLHHHHLLIGQSCPCMFMNMPGWKFANAVLTLYMQKWLILQGGVSMNPSMCRQVLVDERAIGTVEAGLSNQATAMVMGQSEQQWRKQYDMHFHLRLAQNAMNSMACIAALQGLAFCCRSRQMHLLLQHSPTAQARQCVTF